MTLLLVALAGGLGAMARHAVDLLLTPRSPRPGAALALINITGSLAIGVGAGLLAAQVVSAAAATIAMTGFLGGYTTFSAASLDVVELAERAGRRRGALRALVVPVAAVAACAVGLVLGGLAG